MLVAKAIRPNVVSGLSFIREVSGPLPRTHQYKLHSIKYNLIHFENGHVVCEQNPMKEKSEFEASNFATHSQPFYAESAKLP